MKSFRFKTLTLAAAVTAAAMSPALLAAGLDARLNAQKVAVGDSFQLILSTRDPQASAPDLTPLAKDFAVQGTSQSMQTSIINGRKSAQQSWIITLAAKHTGELTIPAIFAGAVSSDTASVQVVDISEMPKAVGADGISVTVSLADQSPHYIYQEIPVTVRMEVRQPIQQATLIAPQSPDFELTQNGEDRLVQGQGVNIIERDYLLRPHTSGELTLGPFVLQGEVADARQTRSPFSGFPFDRSAMLQQFGFGGMFSQGKPFKVRSDATGLQIAGNPDAAAGSWFLPARAVQIEASWESQNPVFRVGEAVSRKISLLALGARPEQLPDLHITGTEDVKLYVDDSRVHQVQSAEGTVARRDTLISVVPTVPGEVTLPEVRVSWLDTGSSEQKEAVLPAQTITVEGIASQAQPAQVTALPAQPEATGTGAAEPASAASDVFALLKDKRYEAAALAVLLLLTLLIIRQRKGSARRQPLADMSARGQGGNAVKTAASSPGADKETVQLEVLREAIRAGDNRQIYLALLSWMRWRQRPQMNAELNREITALEAVVFGSEGSATVTYDSSGLTRILDTVGTPAKRSSEKLPPLYPEQVRHST
ncbi:BatD family protein [Aliamphritea hakodatensis]|uniref:BatD family protein n=1 Tax=Aliamphritea hakodatensis TaxID=2895352 RepID=UPI0022FD4A36|nr:BatD family protein [Aliamphritea hakodatensis]